MYQQVIPDKDSRTTCLVKVIIYSLRIERMVARYTRDCTEKLKSSFGLPK